MQRWRLNCMTIGVQGRAVHKLKNPGTRPVVVVLEPWGGEYDIGPSQALDLVIDGNLDAHLEIEIEENRLTIISDGPDLAIMRDGEPVAAR
jgi:hypothetical protein